MTKSFARITTLVLTLSVFAVIGWTLTYPSESDPKNIKYVLWKIGLYRMNLDAAAGTMIGDGNSEKLVIGKTKRNCEKSLGTY